jgi:hypothetical protein
MELLITLVALVFLGVSSWLGGADSRPGLDDPGHDW